MGSFKVTGGSRLKGEITLQGSKNAVLPILAASLLNRGKTVLKNCPDLSDVAVALEILESLGCVVKRNKDIIEIDSKDAVRYVIKHSLMNKMRSSVMFLGSLIARNKKAVVSYPGGCDLGQRPIDLHIKALNEMNVETEEEMGVLLCVSDEIKAKKIYLDFPSVGATENVMMASVFSKGKTVILNAAREPEIVDLQNFINKMGGKITGGGSGKITIVGVEKLNDVEYEIMPDRIALATYLFSAIATKGHIKINGIRTQDIDSVIDVINQMGVEMNIVENSVEVFGDCEIKPVNIRTKVYPGFPTDAQPLITPVLLRAKERSHIAENIFSKRFAHAKELNKMGADITVAGNIMTINPCRRLLGTKVLAHDLRGGAALIIAGLMAEGETVVENSEFIDRGYENIEEVLRFLGGNIKRIQ